MVRVTIGFLDYNIPSNNRELQLVLLLQLLAIIITYQVITGNYSITDIEKEYIAL